MHLDNEEYSMEDMVCNKGCNKIYGKDDSESTVNQPSSPPLQTPHTHRRAPQAKPARRREITPLLAHSFHFFKEYDDWASHYDLAAYTGMPERTAHKQVEVLLEKQLLKQLDLKPHIYRMANNVQQLEFYHLLTQAVAYYQKRGCFD